MRSIAGLHVGAAVKVARRTPLHDWHAANGGVLDPMGLWMRPRYYTANGADAAAAAVVEARRVRSHGGIADSSTLGKLEIAGPDAAAFLDFMYLTKASSIKVGRSRYMVNLREDGMVLDDGLVLRLAEDRFVATTSSMHGTHMLAHFEHYAATQWAKRTLTVTDVTEAWAVIAVAGPLSRTTLERVLASPWSAALARLKHMDFADGEFDGQQLRLLRASFSGELAFELHCRPASAASLFEQLRAAGLAPYGIDALDILRVEKGYLVSSEINGETTPLDLGLEAMVRAGNPCLGRESARPAGVSRSDPAAPGRSTRARWPASVSRRRAADLGGLGQSALRPYHLERFQPDARRVAGVGVGGQEYRRGRRDPYGPRSAALERHGGAHGLAGAF